MLPDSLPECDWFWTASGKRIGYRENDALFSYCGTQIGVFKGDEVYSELGSYVGEVSNSGRLVADTRKLNWRRRGFAPLNGRTLEVPMDVVPQQLTPGFRNVTPPKGTKNHT
jgi:hypothetical protein